MTNSLFSRFFHRNNSPTVSVDGQPFSALQILRAVSAQQAVLRSHGVSKGDVVAVWTQRDVRTIVALLANVLAGVVTVPLNPSLGSKELAHILNDAKPKVLFASEIAAISEPSQPLVFDDSAAHTLPEDRPIDDSPLFLLYTSGTTGMPKGALLSTRNVLANVDALADAWALSESDTIVHALPLFHVHGLCVGLLGALRAGAAIHWLTQFEARSLADTIAKVAANSQAVLYAVPTMYHRLVDLAEKDPAVAQALAKARLLISGSAALSTRELARMHQATGQHVRERYGLTETLINTAVRAEDVPRAGWVGRALKGIEVALVNDQREPTVPSDGQSIGELRVRGPNVFLGYHHRQDATDAVRDENNWFYTGDLAVMSEDGWVKIVGRRATDLIKSGGYKIGAGEIEGALLEHPSVAECAVLAVDDADLGEKIVAFVVLRAEAGSVTDKALSDWVASSLAPHKRPRIVHFVEQLPRNAMGKVLKKELKEKALQLSHPLSR